MNTATHDLPVQSLANPAAIAFALLAGLALLTVSGMAQATVLHDAAHDQRHAMAFPCH
ncbi:CbtB domain-containing protein [Oceaniglobus indicus]|uniref:CbtB domain-containing protein n=1 Tax=Oceaniglobus indicus TaxID=2047749 RepID=UPI000C197B55|nr:CbtB domain-containing protein [Oceaniglobus indicus]